MEMHGTLKKDIKIDPNSYIDELKDENIKLKQKLKAVSSAKSVV